MLRIDIEQHGEAFAFTLHGRLAGAWVALLQRHWRTISESVPSATITTTLSDVSYVDAEGVRLLERMWREGVRFEASGCMNRHLIDLIEGGSSVTRRRDSNPH